MSHPDFSADFLKATRKKAKKTASGPRSASRAESASIRSKSSTSLDQPRDHPRTWDAAHTQPATGGQSRHGASDACNQLDFPGASQHIGYSWEITRDEDITPVEQQRPLRNIFNLKKSNKPAPLDHKSHSSPDTRMQQYHLPTPHASGSPLDLQGKIDRIGTTLSSPSTPPGWPMWKDHAHDQNYPARSAYDRKPSPEPDSAHVYLPSESQAQGLKMNKRSARPSASPQATSSSQKSHISQIASSRSAPLINVSRPQPNTGLSPPTSPDLGSIHGVAVQQKMSNSPQMSEHRSGTEAQYMSNMQPTTFSGNLRSSFSTVGSDFVEPMRQIRSTESEPWRATEMGLSLQPVKSADSARMSDTDKHAVVSTPDTARHFNPLSSNPVNTSSFPYSPTVSSTVHDNPKSFSRPELNQHHSTINRHTPTDMSPPIDSPVAAMSRSSPRLYEHHNVSDLSVDALTPSPILEEAVSDDGIKSLDTSFKDLNHYDVSPIDEDEDFEFRGSGTGTEMTGYGDERSKTSTRAQELERRWLATTNVR